MHYHTIQQKCPQNAAGPWAKAHDTTAEIQSLSTWVKNAPAWYHIANDPTQEILCRPILCCWFTLSDIQRRSSVITYLWDRLSPSLPGWSSAASIAAI